MLSTSAYAPRYIKVNNVQIDASLVLVIACVRDI
jgi:hypothetical protein